MMKKYRMRSMPVANCYVEINRERFDGDNGAGRLASISLVSYTTRMLRINIDKFGNASLDVLYPVDCSVTTARHVNRFTTEFFGSNWYHELKKQHYDEFGVAVNVTYLLYYIVDTAMWYEQNGKQIRH